VIISLFVSGVYRPPHAVHQSIRVSRLTDDYLTDEENLEQMLVCSLFLTKVFRACRDAGVTPQSATGSEVNLVSLMRDTEIELDVYWSPDEMSRLSERKLSEVESRTKQRRGYCYAVMYRMTSGQIIS
jgi:hypothetical protein